MVEGRSIARKDNNVPNKRSFGLAIRQRVAFGIAGLSALVAGGTATFATDNGAGAATLIGAGIIMFFLSVTGQELSRLKIGDAEAGFYRKLGEVTADAATSGEDGEGSAVTARQLVSAVAYSSNGVPEKIRDNVLAPEGYEREVMRSLANVCDLSPDGGTGRDFRFDARIGTIGIEVKYRGAGRSPGVNALSSNGAYNHLVEAAAHYGLSAVLIITNSTVANGGVREDVRSRSGQIIRVRIVQWNPSDGDSVLANVISSMA